MVHLKKLLEQYPGFDIYIAGHSLGGSLANLTAFQLAGVPEIPSPITVVTFGALLIGDLRFRRAFQVYEAENRIRCVGVMNDGDIIPLLPPRAFLRPYRHVGTKLVISDKKAVITRHPITRSLCGAFVKDIPNQFVFWMRLWGILCCVKNFGDNHSVLAYSKNLIAVENDLRKLTIDEVCTCGKG